MAKFLISDYQFNIKVGGFSMSFCHLTSRYKMCPLLVVSALGDSSNKMVTRITWKSLNNSRHP